MNNPDSPRTDEEATVTIAMIPQPAKLREGTGHFSLSPGTAIQAGDGLQAVAQVARALLARATGYDLPIESLDQAPGAIRLVLAPEGQHMGAEGSVLCDLGAEGYALRVTADEITLSAPAPAGIFYGVQTLRQLLPAAIENETVVPGRTWTVPCVEIEDTPRFSWRGVMLDEGRHFRGKAEVKRFLDLMALHKLNVFHWHLTEDQGWRIEIEKYPRLTEVGSQRRATRRSMFGKDDDGTPHGGYYTQAEVREIVAYAGERFITVVPEIEMPGHSQAALVAYPELSCTGGPFEVSTRFGIHRDIYCAGKEETYTFLQDVLDEVMALFPSEVIHIGGDEAPKERWKDCPDCQARLRSEGIADVHGLQTYMTNRMARYLAERGRRLMGWNQILNDGLDRSAIGHYWVGGMKRVLAHARGGGDLVMSDVRYAYLDHSYAFTPLSSAYKYEPVPAKLKVEHHEHVLGLEAPLWTEFVRSLKRFDFQCFPRLTALAETAWTPREDKDYASFQARLGPFLERLDRLGVEYASGDDVEPGLFRRLLSPFTMFSGPDF